MTIGGTLGLILGLVGVRMLANQFAGLLPRTYMPVVDGNVLLFTLAITVIAGLFFGLIPSIQTFRKSQSDVLRDGGARGGAGAGKRLVSRVLVVGEIALSLVALGGGSVMVRAFLELQNADPGFVQENLLTVQFSVPQSKYEGDEETGLLLEGIQTRIAGLAGVSSASLVSTLPQNFLAPSDTFRVDGGPAEEGQRAPRSVYVFASETYLETMDIPLLQGRFFSESNRLDQPKVAVINRSMAESAFPDGSPLGRRVTIQGESREIIGVAADVRQVLVRGSGGSDEGVYLPMAQTPQRSVFLMLRTVGDPHELADAVRTALGDADPDLTVNTVQTMQEFVDQFFVGIQVFNSVLGGFGLMALFLAALGTYGVLAYSVGQRTHEIGVRMAIGARPSQVVKMVSRQGLTMGVIGLALGSVIVIPVTMFIGSLLEGLGSVQPLTVVGVGVVLFLVTALASFLPARRAAMVDPVVALRVD